MSDTEPTERFNELMDGLTRRALANQLSGQLAASLKPEPIRTPMSLYKIESELAELVELMREAQEDLDSGKDPAAAAQIQAIEQQIANYLGSEVQKIDSYHGLLKFGVNLIEQIKAEENRLRGQRKAWEGAIERVKAAAVFVMQAIGKKRLEGSHGRRLRLHPSPASVVIDDAKIVPDEFINISLSLPLETWQKILRWAATKMGVHVYAILDEATQHSTSQISLSRIKAFIEAGMVCPECITDKCMCRIGLTTCGYTADKHFRHSGLPMDHTFTPSVPVHDCPRCQGKGRIPALVPGARLVTDKMHLRCE